MLPNLSLLDIGGGKRSSDQREEEEVSRETKKKIDYNHRPLVATPTIATPTIASPEAYDMIYAREALVYALFVLQHSEINTPFLSELKEEIKENEDIFSLENINVSWSWTFNNQLYGALTKRMIESKKREITTNSMLTTLNDIMLVRGGTTDELKNFGLPLYRVHRLDEFQSFIQTDTLPSQPPQGYFASWIRPSQPLPLSGLQIVSNISMYVFPYDDMGAPVHVDMNSLHYLENDGFLALNALRRCRAVFPPRHTQEVPAETKSNLESLTSFYVRAAFWCLNLISTSDPENSSGLSSLSCKFKPVTNKRATRLKQRRNIDNEAMFDEFGTPIYENPFEDILDVETLFCTLPWEYFVDPSQDEVEIDPNFFVLAT